MKKKKLISLLIVFVIFMFVPFFDVNAALTETKLDSCRFNLDSSDKVALTKIEFYFVEYNTGRKRVVIIDHSNEKADESGFDLSTEGNIVTKDLNGVQAKFHFSPETVKTIWAEDFCQNNLYIIEAAASNYSIKATKPEADFDSKSTQLIAGPFGGYDNYQPIEDNPAQDPSTLNPNDTSNSLNTSTNESDNKKSEDYEEIVPPNLDSEEITCKSIFRDEDENFNELGQLLQDVFTFMKVAAPILLIGLSSLDYIKAIASKDADDLKKANERFIKRLIAAIALFLLPFILDLIFDVFGVYDMQTCGIK